MAEILQQDYADSTQIDLLKSEILIEGKKERQLIGLETGEDTGDRSRFDDIDDYHGWSASPPQEKDGTTMSHLTGWEREVVVLYVQDDDPAKDVAKDEGAKLITVTVKHDDVLVAELEALRTIGSPPQEACCLPDRTCVDMLTAVCTALGGEAQGADTTCATTDCSSCLVAHWEFEEGGGPTAGDSAGNHNATLTNHGWTAGKFNGGLSLSGNGAGVVAYDPELFASGQLTVMGWFNSGDASGYHMIFSNGTTGNNQNPWFATWDAELNFGFYDGAYREVSTTGLGWQTNVWYHAAATFDSTTDEVLLYLDGVEVLAGTISYDFIDHGDDLIIGNSQFDESWKGILDDLRIYNCVLEADEKRINPTFILRQADEELIREPGGKFRALFPEAPDARADSVDVFDAVFGEDPLSRPFTTVVLAQDEQRPINISIRESLDQALRLPGQNLQLTVSLGSVSNSAAYSSLSGHGTRK
ncbi:MAG: LamG domain-containing protein [Bacteroidetes bacterium]|nr:LamG domain-containing protein [Bacteroidota bacterium]